MRVETDVIEKIEVTNSCTGEDGILSISQDRDWFFGKCVQVTSFTSKTTGVTTILGIEETEIGVSQND